MKQNTKACGTVQPNRKNVPKSLSLDNNLQKGDIHGENSNGISFVKSMDMISVLPNLFLRCRLVQSREYRQGLLKR